MLVSSFNISLLLFASLSVAINIPTKAGKFRRRSCRRDPTNPRDHHVWAGHWTRTSGAVAGSTLEFVLPAPTGTPPTLLTQPPGSQPVDAVDTGSKAAGASVDSSEPVPTVLPIQLSPEESPGPPSDQTANKVAAAEKAKSAPSTPQAAAPPTRVFQTPPEQPSSPPATKDSVSSPVGLSVDYKSNCKGASFPNIGWYYSWTMQTWPGMEGIPFVPMVMNRAAAREFKPEQLGSAQYAMSINEPDNAGQHENVPMSISEAVQLHKLWTTKVPQGVQIGSVAVTNGGKEYWDQWKTECGGSCRYDFIPIHFYGFTAAEFIQYAKRYANEGKPLWVTEIACRAYTGEGIKVCSLAETQKMMKASIGWMRGEGASLVHRWTWFGAWSVGSGPEGDSEGFNLLNSKGEANELGKLFASL